MDEGRSLGIRSGLIGLVLGLVVGAAACVLAYVEGRERLAESETQHAQQLEAARAATASVAQEAAEARSVSAVLRARLEANLAVVELDRANFGLSQERLRAVGAALSDVDPAAAGVDPKSLADANALVSDVLISSGPGAPDWRARLVEVQNAVDRLVPRETRG